MKELKNNIMNLIMEMYDVVIRVGEELITWLILAVVFLFTPIILIVVFIYKNFIEGRRANDQKKK